MFAKIAVLACAIAIARAGVIANAYPVVNGYAAPAVAAPIAYTGYAAPAMASYAAPAHTYAGPALAATSENVYRSPGNLHTVATHTKSIATPFSVSNKHFTSVTNPGVYETAAYAAPVATYAAAPVARAVYAPAPVAHHHAHAYAPVAHSAHGQSLLGVAYSPSVAVSHMTYSSPMGLNYAW